MAVTAWGYGLVLTMAVAITAVVVVTIKWW